MATNPNDRKENKGLKGFAKKNFGRDEGGRSFIANFVKGAATGPTAGFSIKESGVLPAWGGYYAINLYHGLRRR